MNKNILRGKLVSIIDKLFPKRFCWTDLIMWARKDIFPNSPERFPWWSNTKGCQAEGKELSCYCTKFCKGLQRKIKTTPTP